MKAKKHYRNYWTAPGRKLRKVPALCGNPIPAEFRSLFNISPQAGDEYVSAIELKEVSTKGVTRGGYR